MQQRMSHFNFQSLARSSWSEAKVVANPLLCQDVSFEGRWSRAAMQTATPRVRLTPFLGACGAMLPGERGPVPFQGSALLLPGRVVSRKSLETPTTAHGTSRRSLEDESCVPPAPKVRLLASDLVAPSHPLRLLAFWCLVAMSI